MGMTIGQRHYLVDKWYREELGRRASLADLDHWQKVIDENGEYAAFNGIYTSPEAEQHRNRVGRKV